VHVVAVDKAQRFESALHDCRAQRASQITCLKINGAD